MVTQHSSLHSYFDKPTRWKHFRGLYRSATLDMTPTDPTSFLPALRTSRNKDCHSLRAGSIAFQRSLNGKANWDIEISIIELCKNRTQSRLELTLITAVELEKFEDPRRAVNLVMKLSKYQFRTWLITLNIRQIAYPGSNSIPDIWFRFYIRLHWKWYKSWFEIVAEHHNFLIKKMCVSCGDLTWCSYEFATM